MNMEKDREPDWANRARHIAHKPEWVDMIPHTLWELGEVFFPIPPREKGWNYPHHMEEYRYSATSETLNAYLEIGWGYGMSCAGDIAVVDIDDPELVDPITSELPETAWQKTGSRTGYHLIYRVPGLNSRVMFYKEVTHECDKDEHTCELDENGDCIRVTDYDHAGEVKCDPHGYVVGPGSTHPSGNIYGPLQGDTIAEISKEELLEVVDKYERPEDYNTTQTAQTYDPEDPPEDVHGLYELSANEVLPWLSPGDRISHPVHGSSTGSNFMKNDDGETFTCWRCSYGSSEGCGLNGAQFLAAEETGLDCDLIRNRWPTDTKLHYRAWLNAVKQGLVEPENPPYKVIHGYGVVEGMTEADQDIGGELYHDVRKALVYETQVDVLGRQQ